MTGNKKLDQDKFCLISAYHTLLYHSLPHYGINERMVVLSEGRANLDGITPASALQPATPLVRNYNKHVIFHNVQPQSGHLNHSSKVRLCTLLAIDLMKSFTAHQARIKHATSRHVEYKRPLLTCSITDCLSDCCSGRRTTPAHRYHSLC